MKKNKFYILFAVLIIFGIAVFNIQCSPPSTATTEKAGVKIPAVASTDTTEASISETIDAATNAKLTTDSLKNLEYKVEYAQSRVAKLANGEYQEEAAPGSATKIVVKLTEYIAFGDLNNDNVEDAAVILVSEPGGSGTFYDLAVVLNKEGNLESTNSVLLGDRIKIKAISIDSGIVTVNYLDRKEDQAMAEEPTIDKIQKFIIENDILSLATTVATTAATTTKITGTFEGIIPCADCEGIQSDITINPDSTYILKLTYLGTDVEPYTANGNWKIDDKGRLVLLKADGKSAEQYLKIVSQNEIKMLDGDGNEITGTNLNFSLKRK
jgi:NlpE N-terminal domain